MFVLVRLLASGVVASDRAVSFGEPVRIDVNRAPVMVLALLPGIGPGRAAAIVLHRVRHGWFDGFEALSRVDGIGPKTLAGLRPMVCFCPCGTRVDAPLDCAAHGVGSEARR